MSTCSFAVRGPWSVLVLFLAALLATSAHAQQYAVDKVNDEVRRLHGAKAQRWIRDAKSWADERAIYDEFFDTYYFPSMTRHGADDLRGLGDSRYNLFKLYLWGTSNEQLQRDLTGKAFAHMRRIVTANNPPYHPAVQYNAALILGMLDEQYAIEAGPNRRPPRPHVEANDLLIRIVAAAAEERAVPSVLLLGALIGLERHAQYRDALPPGAVEKMSETMLKLVNRDQPLPELDREAYAWLRLRAASVLAQLGSLGPNNAVHDALVKLAAESRSLDDRCAAAALLAKLPYEDATVEDPATVEALLKLARDLAAEEDQRAQDFQDAQLGGGGFAAGRGGRFAGAGFGQQIAFPRRHVLARLADLRSGLRAVKPALPEDAQAKIDEVVKAINPAISAAANKETVDLIVARTIRTMAGEIDLATTPPAEPAVEAEVEEAA